MNNRNRYLFKNTVIFAVGSLGTKLINFFLVPLYTNILTPSEYGTADLIYSIVSVLVSLLTLNICESVMRYSLDKQADHNKIMSTGYMCLLVCIVVGCCAIPILRRSDGLNAYAEYIYIYMVAFAFSQLFLFYLQGKELLLHFSIANIIQTAVVATLNILFLVFFIVELRVIYLLISSLIL